MQRLDGYHIVFAVSVLTYCVCACGNLICMVEVLIIRLHLVQSTIFLVERKVLAQKTNRIDDIEKRDISSLCCPNFDKPSASDPIACVTLSHPRSKEFQVLQIS